MKEERYIEVAKELQSHCNTHQIAVNVIHCNLLQQQYVYDMVGLGGSQEERDVEAVEELESHCNTHQLTATCCNRL